MPPLANPKHEMFASGLAQGMPAIEAYAKSGHTPQASSASRLAKNAKVRARVAELIDRKQERFILSKQWVIDMLVMNAQRSLQVVAVTDEEGNPIGEFKYEGNVANRSLELVGKELGMFVDRSLNVNVNVDVSDKPVKAAAPEVIEAQASEWAKEHGGDDDGP